MNYQPHITDRRPRPPMLPFRTRTFAAIVAFSVFALLYMSVGLRWHTHRARASYYARQEVEHTFQAAHYARAARNGSSIDRSQANAYRKLAEMHERAAQENSRLRKLYENSW